MFRDQSQDTCDDPFLCNRSHTLLQIALESGFASPAHFIHASRQHFSGARSPFEVRCKNKETGNFRQAGIRDMSLV